MTQSRVILPKHTKMKRLPDGTYRACKEGEQGDTELLQDITEDHLFPESSQPMYEQSYFAIVPAPCPYCNGKGFIGGHLVEIPNDVL